MTSSLLFITSTVGSVAFDQMISIFLRIIIQFCYRCLAVWACLCTYGTRSAEKYNWQGNGQECCLSTTLSKILHSSYQRTIHSPSFARCRILVGASILHAGFFVIMGTSVSFANVLCAYSVSAFSRAFLTGEISFQSNFHNSYLHLSRQAPRKSIAATPLSSAKQTVINRNAYVASTPGRPLGLLHASWGELSRVRLLNLTWSCV